jgi:glyoxylase-like metal-dependent hydrolase (beta-lactamase superfamily II)
MDEGQPLSMTKGGLIFQQLFEVESSTYTYLLADQASGEAVSIDPVLETVERDLNLLKELGLTLKYTLETHVHADHITGAAKIREKTRAKTVLSAEANVDCADILLHDGDILQFGGQTLKALSTQGHTDSCMSYYISGMVFTGDSLMIRAAGRTDFQQGSSAKLYESITKKLYALPDETIVYPGHDYKGMTSSTIGAEKKNNPRIGLDKSEADFIKIMSELNLAMPKKLHEAVPANLKCGRR